VVCHRRFCGSAVLHFRERRRDILVGPSYANWDLSLIKQARFADGSLVEFRVELFNAFNQVNFELPYAVLARRRSARYSARTGPGK